ncbi:5-deoxy-glucuronate isomerase [Meinhardsimonia xiamenensis]|jgi:5-deoxy-glucuronate isomerase|uniref:5-deoxy-glucuronate isomerase n=1 Tax=Meinhardsimonia xiamenensis TaxID=990712 RepID=A0A1G9BCF7_9RHOB|nr:5-deoxy-glucuronate isomerase [Meinhardsimonia xiamenensis]PRX35053.1 5-deoxy-glucuronate isomerase [Meinhardsimonia xiamenensis]SDK36545.1 5-deoxy-glucuronate isomerase [Meinhardsimonia xiamenensis]
MSVLLRKPVAVTGKIHDITPNKAAWERLGLGIYRLEPGELVAEPTGENEVILVLIEGRAEIGVEDRDFGELGNRMDVFDKSAPHAVYIPNGSDWSARATTPATLAVCAAPGHHGHPAQIIGPAGIHLEERGTGTATRFVHNIAMDNRDVADSLLVREVFTPAGHWSAYPPYRHDEDDHPRISRLEAACYHRLNPHTGFGVQRVFTEDGELDECMAFADHDVVLVPRGYHPCAAPHGVEMYSLIAMAGPQRKWRFEVHPDFRWLVERDAV